MKIKYGVSKSPAFVSEILKNLSVINSETREKSPKKARKNLGSINKRIVKAKKDGIIKSKRKK